MEYQYQYQVPGERFVLAPDKAERPRVAPMFALGLAAFWYHVFAGLRHLAWDAGFGFEKKTARSSGRAVVLLAAAAFLASLFLTPAGRFLAGAP